MRQTSDDAIQTSVGIDGAIGYELEFVTFQIRYMRHTPAVVYVVLCGTNCQ